MDKKQDDINYYALTFVNTDNKGIVAETTKILFDNGFNLADSSSTLLEGIFSMIFIVTNSKNYKEQEIKDLFKNIRSCMEVFKFNKKPEIKNGIHYSISVYGADKTGIVYAITNKIAENNLNIIDLQTKITGGNTKVYIMLLEIVAESEDNENIWQESLKKTAMKINTQINIKKIEFYEL